MIEDKIKEILEDVKRHLDYVEATKRASIRDNEMKAMYDYITNLEQKSYKDDVIITKAIEYIKECKIIDKDFQVDYCIDEDIKEDLLNILTGGDKE